MDPAEIAGAGKQNWLAECINYSRCSDMEASCLVQIKPRWLEAFLKPIERMVAGC